MPEQTKPTVEMGRSSSAVGRHLVLAAFWAEGEPSASVDATFDALDGIGEPGTGGISALLEPRVDVRLRSFLRSIEGLEDAGDA
jgi:hypothetical protein